MAQSFRWSGVLLVAALVAMPVAAQDISTFVTMDDGVGLATEVYLPLFGDRWPVILVRTPYGKDDLRIAAEAVAILGYAVVLQDTRGRFDSGGVDTVFRDDRRDGHLTIDWAENQEWCDGRIGMFGGSAFAITQYLPAPGAGTALRSIMPVVATPDMYRHAFLQGGAIREALAFNWLDGQGSLYMYDEVRRHRFRDGWWNPVEVLAFSSTVTAAGLHIGGWYDIFGQGTIDAFTAFQKHGGVGARGRQYLIMGPWTHSSLGGSEVGEVRYPDNAELDPFDLVLPWFDHTLKDRHSEVDDWPAVRVYLMGAVDEPGAPGNEWVELDEWPPSGRCRSLYLSPAGELTLGSPQAGEVEVEMDPSEAVPTLGGSNLHPGLVVDGREMGDGPYDQRSIEDRADVVTFTSPTLDDALTAMGRVRCVLWVRPDTTDLDLAVRLTDVYPDGRSMLVADGIQRARMRCGDRRECLLTPGQPTPITVDLWSTAYVFNNGHRIRVSVSGSNSPRFEVNPNHGGDLNGDDPPVVARPRLLVGAPYMSRLELPVPTPRRVRGTQTIR
jgi:predicted acyl esterase